MRRQGIGQWQPDQIGRATQQEGQSLERLGSTEGQVGEEIGNSADQIQLAQATGAAHAAIIDAHAQLPSITDPSQVLPKDPNTPAPAFASVGQQVNNARSMISNPKIQAEFDARMQPVIATYGAASQQRGRELNNQAGLASLDTNTTSIINSAATIDDEASAGHALDGIQAQIAPLVASGALNPVQAVAYRKQVAEQFVEARQKYLLGQAEQTRDYSKLEAFSAAHGLGGSLPDLGGTPTTPANAPPATGTGTGQVTQGPATGLSPSGGPWVKGADGKTYATDSDGNVDTKVQPISPTAASAAGQVAGPGAPSSASAPLSTPQGLAAYKQATARIESGSGKNEGALGSYYQFEPDTWARHAQAGDSKGTAAGEDGPMNRLTAANLSSLTGSLGRPPTPAELYLAHQQGAGGAAALLANPNTPAGQLVPPSNIRNNGGDPNAPAAQFVALWGKKYAQAAGQPWTPDLSTPRSALAQRGMPAPGAPSIAASDAYRAGLTDALAIQPPPTQVASLGPVGLPVAPPGPGAAPGMLPGAATPDDVSASTSSRAPPSSMWPEGAQSVAANADGSLSYQMSDGSFRPVTGSKATGAPHPQLPPPPQGSILSLLPPEKRAQMQLSTIQEITRMQREDAMANQRDTRGDIAAIGNSVKQMETGLPLGNDVWEQQRQAYANSPDPQVRYNFAVADATRNTLQRFQGAPPAQVAAAISNMQSEYEKQINTPGGAATGGVLGAVIQSSQNYLKAYEQGVAKDPIGRAAMEGAITGVKALDPSSPTFSQDVTDRVQQAKDAASMFGQKGTPTFLRPDDKIALRNLAQAGGQPMVDLAKGIVAGAGSDAPAVFQQIGREAAPLAQIGQWAVDPNADHTTQIERYAQYIAASRDPQASKDLPKVTEQTMRSSRVSDPLKDAMVEFTPDAVGRTRNTANILASEAAGESNTDPKDTTNNSALGTIIQKSYHEAVGGTQDTKTGNWYGGIAQVGGSWWRGSAGGYNAVVPTNMRQDQFETALGQVNQSDVNQMGPPPVGSNGVLSAEDIKKGKFVAVPDKASGMFGGRYRVLLPDPAQGNSMQPVLGQDGKPWIFDMNRAQQNGLDKRVPDAFMPQAAPLPTPAQGQYRNVKGLSLSPDVASSDTEAAPQP